MRRDSIKINETEKKEVSFGRVSQIIKFITPEIVRNIC
jgi:predicted HTH domain antitoxin